MSDSKKITIGIPTNRGVKAMTVLSLLKMVEENKSFNFHFIVETEGISIEDNRNAIVEQALKEKSDYLLFVDDDMIFEPNLLTNLLNKNKKIIGVNSYSRHEEGFSTVRLEGTQRQVRLFPTTLFSCLVVGTGLMLIDMTIFSLLSKPYFKIERYGDGKVKLGEDVYFCQKAKGEGIEIWCDPTIKVGHIGDKIFGKDKL